MVMEGVFWDAYCRQVSTEMHIRLCHLTSAAIVLPMTIWFVYQLFPSEPTYSFVTLTPATLISDEVDYARLVNLTDFKFEIFEDVCKDFSPFLLVLVVSSFNNFQRRMVIRQTWGRNTDKVRTAFLLASNRSEDFELERQVILENAQHRDLLLGNFVDAYRNLTYKHVMALKYVTYHCPMAKYVLKADDDVFVNTPVLLDLLDREFFAEENLILCKSKNTSRVVRTPKLKWAVTVEEYAGRFFPPYCWGFAVVYTPDAVAKLYRTAQWSKFFWIEDIFVTGIAAKLANLTQTDASPYVLKKRELERIKKGAWVWRKFLFAFNLSERLILQLWTNNNINSSHSVSLISL